MRNPTLAELFLRPPVRVPGATTLRQAAALMEDEHISSLLVGTAPTAVLTEHDLAGALAAGMDAGAAVSAVATKAALWTTTATTLVDAVGMMTGCGIRHLLVLSPEGTERGVLSLRQATRVLLEGAPPAAGPARLGAASRTGSRPGAPHPVGQLRTIAVGLDGSADAEAALRWALDLARRVDAEVVTVHAVGLLGRAGGRTGDDLELAVRRLAAAEGVEESTVRCVAAEGDPCSALVRATAPPVAADLLVVGSRGRGAHAGLLLGSTSHALAERAPVPLVIVPGPSGQGAPGGEGASADV